MEAAGPTRTLRFGVFAFDLRTGELTKSGRKVSIREQPTRVLVALLEQPGEVVSREELQRKVWQADTFVDFDPGINKAIAKIREALSDSADSPRFVKLYRDVDTALSHPCRPCPASLRLLRLPRRNLANRLPPAGPKARRKGRRRYLYGLLHG